MEKASSRLKVLALLVVLMFVALSTRLWFLQVLATTQFQQEARDNSVRFVYSEPLRGLIKDDHGHILVQNRESLEVRVTRDALGSDAEAVILRLSKLLNVPVHVLVQRLQTNQYYSYQPIPVAEFVSPHVRDYIAEYGELFPGVEVVPTSVREYPYGRTAAHVLGYDGLISAAEYDKLKNKGYAQTDVIGKTGLEQVYEHYLRGTQGIQKFIVNSNGDTTRALGVKDPTAGDDLHLTLDLRIQRAAEQQLADGLANIRTQTDSRTGQPLKANAGTVIVMDAQTGAIRAMASSPSYDPRWLVRGLTKAQQQYLYKNPAAPAINRAVQLPYVPGSTFKPITGLAAMKEGFASMGGYYPCTATYTHPGDTSGTVFSNWTTADLGSLSLSDAIRISCDTVFDKFGSDFYFTPDFIDGKNNSLGSRLRELVAGVGQHYKFRMPDCFLKSVRMLVWFEYAILRTGDDCYRHLDTRVMLTNGFQTRPESSFIISTCSDLIRLCPHLHRTLYVIVVHILRIISLFQTFFHQGTSNKRRQGLNDKLAKHRNMRQQRPPFNADGWKCCRRK